MKPPELTDDQYYALDSVWGCKEAKEDIKKHIGWFFWLQFDEHDGNSGIYNSMSDDFKMYEFYPNGNNDPNWFGDVFHQDGTKVSCKTIEDYLNELGKMWMITGRKWDKKVIGYGYKKAYI
jgi:hypothetical protein